MELSVTVDFPDDVSKGPFTPERLDELMTTIASIGATRVNWMYYGETEPSDPRRGTIWNWHPVLYGPQSIAALGEPLRAAVPRARAKGMEIFGVLKPYYNGVSGSYPAGSPRTTNCSPLSKIGGPLQHVLPFLEAHPEMRLQRRPLPRPDSATGPIREIRLTKSDDRETRLRPEHIRIWTSADNYQYRPLPIVPTGTLAVETARREVRNYHGEILTRAGDPVQVLRLTGLNLDAPFVVLTTTYAEGTGDYRNTAVGMVEIFGDNGPLACVVATHAAGWINPRDFRTFGLEFDMGYGHLPVTLDEPWRTPEGNPWQHFSGEDMYEGHAIFGRGPAGGFLGFALGKNEFLPAVPCEAYPEVRAIWLGWIKAMLDAGVDGVDLRISAHGCLSDEPEAYGWNPPVLAAYCERHGPGPIDPTKLAVVRGDIYTAFLREASAMVRQRGKKLQVHLHSEAFHPHPVFGQINGFPANIEFQWRRWIEEKLVDEVTLRTSWYEGAEDKLGTKETRRSRLTNALADPVAVEMLEVATRARLPITLNRYIGRAAGLAEYLDDITWANNNGRIARFDIYESFDLVQADPGKPGLIPLHGRPSALKARWEMLRKP